MTTADATYPATPQGVAAESDAVTPTVSSKTEAHDFALSLQTKGLIVFATLIVYLVGISLFALNQKNLLLHEFEKIHVALQDEAILAQAHESIFHAIGAIAINFSESSTKAGIQRMQMHQQLFGARQTAVTEHFPLFPLNGAHVNAAFETANKNPIPGNMSLLLVELMESERDLVKLIKEVRQNRESLSEQFRAQSDSAAMTIAVLGILGLMLLGATIGLFFRRLTIALLALQTAALETVRGIRGKPILVTRQDEVGQLMVAVNSMADTLDVKQQELLFERQKYFHQEKMAAIGVLAAGISHEIGNPIAAISGVAQEMMERRALGRLTGSLEKCHGCQPELIFSQAARLTAITREIAEFASPLAAEPQLLDLNAQLRSTASLIRYDKRLTQIRLKLNLDSQLPAIFGVADQLTQMIMNLIINAMDALEEVHDRTPTITIATSVETDRARLVISDNGMGIDQQVLNRVFEAFFTTKSAGKGTGLGLSLCYSIAQAHGGSIEIESKLGSGTQVTIYFPLNH